MHTHTQGEKSYHPFVSIALTTSKSEKFLNEQMDSLINQTYKNLEIVVSHDECGDRTKELLDEYVKKDARIRWEFNKLEKGFIKNTENVISMCKGEIIFLCDHDDTWDLTRVEEHVKAYRDPSVYWVYNRLVLTDEDNKKELGYLEDKLPDYYSRERMKLLHYTWGSCIGGAMTSYRADLLHSVMPIGKYAPGHDAWIQLAIWPKKPFFINKVLQNYRQHLQNQVGWNSTPTPDEFKQKEKQAIADNLRYLRALPANTNLALWKRFVFWSVYWIKRARQMVTR